MGDLFTRVLTPPDGLPPLIVHSDRFEVYGYGLPGSGHLVQHLARAGSQQFEESGWFVGQLQQAIRAWEELVDRAALVVLREVLGALVTDDELIDSLSCVPDWFSKI
jgi:hypothetical protein